MSSRVVRGWRHRPARSMSPNHQRGVLCGYRGNGSPGAASLVLIAHDAQDVGELYTENVQSMGIRVLAASDVTRSIQGERS
jgi:hypothetical protein